MHPPVTIHFIHDTNYPIVTTPPKPLPSQAPLATPHESGMLPPFMPDPIPPPARAPTPALAIRPAGPDDIPLLNRLAHDIWWACYHGMIPDGQIRFMLDWMYAPDVIRRAIETGTHWEIGELETTPIAYLSWSMSPDSRTLHLHKLYLAPSFHRQGIGQALLEHVRTTARSMGASHVQLRVNRHNTRAQRAYQRAGFLHSHDVCEDIGNGFVMDDHVLILPLT